MSIEPSLLLSGWSPTEDSLDLVDLSIAIQQDVHRSPLADMTMALVNHAIPVYGRALQSDVPRDVCAAVTVNSDSHIRSDPCSADVPYSQVHTPRTSPKCASAQGALLRTADTTENAPLYPTTVLRCSARGRPIGGVPPALARIVTSRVIKKEHAKSCAILEAKRANVSSRSSSNHITSVLQQPEASTSTNQDLTVNFLYNHQEVSSIPVVDRSWRREYVGRRHVQDPTRGPLSYTVSEHSSDLFVGDLMPTVDVEMSTASGDVLQVEMPSQRSPSGFTYASSPREHDQNIASTHETQTSSVGFWPIGQRVKVTKRRLDGKHEGCATKRPRV